MGLCHPHSRFNNSSVCRKFRDDQIGAGREQAFALARVKRVAGCLVGCHAQAIAPACARITDFHRAITGDQQLGPAEPVFIQDALDHQVFCSRFPNRPWLHRYVP